MTCGITCAFTMAAALLLTAGSAQAADIDAMITPAMKAAIDELAPSFERASGHQVRVVYGPSGGLTRRFNSGEPADLIVVDSKALEDLIAQGKVAPGRTDVVFVGLIVIAALAFAFSGGLRWLEGRLVPWKGKL